VEWLKAIKNKAKAGEARYLVPRKTRPYLKAMILLLNKDLPSFASLKMTKIASVRRTILL